MNVKRLLTGIFVFVIIFVFTFAGFKSQKMISKMGHKSIAFYVEDEPVLMQEVQAAAMNYMRQFIGPDQEPNSSQLEIIKQLVSQSLIEMNMFYVFAKKQGLRVSKEEVKERIKSMEVFFQDNQFSMVQYKDLLKRQQMTPEHFEKQVIKENLYLTGRGLTNSLLFSSSLVKEVEEKESKSIQLTHLKLNPADFKNFVIIQESQIKDYIQNNPHEIEKRYKEKDYLYHQKEKYILGLLTQEQLTEKEEKNLTYDNFVKVHEQHVGKFKNLSSESLPPEILEKIRSLSAKKVEKMSYQGREIYFAYEQKIPAKVITLDQVQEKLAKELLQESLTQEQEKICYEVRDQVRELFKIKDFKGAENLLSKYQLNLERKVVPLIEEYQFKDLGLGFHEKGLELIYIHEFINQKNPFKKEKFQKSLQEDLLKGIKVTNG